MVVQSGFQGERADVLANAGGIDDIGPTTPQKDSWGKQSRWWREAGLVLLVAFAVAIALRTFVVQTFFIPSGSMEPTLQIGDRILVNKLSYHLHGVNRGDIVVFARPPAENCGGPRWRPGQAGHRTPRGDHLVVGGYVDINGKRLNESWLPQPPSRA
jgi:signal peptidase I